MVDSCLCLSLSLSPSLSDRGEPSHNTCKAGQHRQRGEVHVLLQVHNRHAHGGRYRS